MRGCTILQVLPEMETGGAELSALQVSAAVAEAGGRALVASAGGRMVSDLVSLGVEPVDMPLASKNPAIMAANARALARLVRDEEISLVHARSRAPAWSALWAARRTGVPFVTTYHGIYNEASRAKRLYNSVMARGDTVIANSHHTARIVAERHAEARKRITVVHRGTDLEAFREMPRARVSALRQAWGVPDGKRIVLHLARLTPWKGQRVAIEAAARLDDPDLVLVLAGDAQGREAYRRELEASIGACGLGTRVRMPGHCADVPAAMHAADAVVVASIEPEAFGRAAVEAQAAGKPVIVSDLGAVPETVLAPPDVEAARRTGWRVAPNDPDRLAAALGEALSLAEDERKALAARARTHAADFSVEAMTGATLDIYRSLLDRGGIDGVIARGLEAIA